MRPRALPSKGTGGIFLRLYHTFWIVKSFKLSFVFILLLRFLSFNRFTQDDPAIDRQRTEVD